MHKNTNQKQHAYDIQVVGTYIELHLNASNSVEYFDYSPELLQLLSTPHGLSYFIVANRAYAKIRIPHQKQCNIALSRLAYAFYNGLINEKDFKEKLPDVMKQISGSGFEIDHANNDIHNHCSWNLSAISSMANKKKSTLCAQILPPYFLYIAVTSDSTYRIELGYRKGLEQHLFILCHSVDDLICCIDSARRAGGWHNTPALVLKKARYIKRKFGKKTPHAALNFSAASQHAEKLLSMDESAFLIWQKTYSFKIVDIFSKFRKNRPCPPLHELAKIFKWDENTD